MNRWHHLCSITSSCTYSTSSVTVIPAWQFRRTKQNSTHDGHEKCLQHLEWKYHNLMETNLLGTKNATVINWRTHTVNAIILTGLVQHSLKEMVRRLLGSQRKLLIWWASVNYSRSTLYQTAMCELLKNYPLSGSQINDGCKILKGCVKFRFWQKKIPTLE